MNNDVKNLDGITLVDAVKQVVSPPFGELFVCVAYKGVDGKTKVSLCGTPDGYIGSELSVAATEALMSVMEEVLPIEAEAGKQMANHPCACGSGKKYKRCCGRAG